MSNQQPPNPQQPHQGPYLQQPPPGYYIPVKTGPSAGKVILIILGLVFIVLPILIFLFFLVAAQLT